MRSTRPGGWNWHGYFVNVSAPISTIDTAEGCVLRLENYLSNDYSHVGVFGANFSIVQNLALKLECFPVLNWKAS